MEEESRRHRQNGGRVNLGSLGDASFIKRHTRPSSSTMTSKQDIDYPELGIKATFEFSRPVDLWLVPVRTVSRSESGYESNLQGISVIPNLPLAAGYPWTSQSGSRSQGKARPENRQVIDSLRAPISSMSDRVPHSGQSASCALVFRPSQDRGRRFIGPWALRSDPAGPVLICVCKQASKPPFRAARSGPAPVPSPYSRDRSRRAFA